MLLLDPENPVEDSPRLEASNLPEDVEEYAAVRKRRHAAAEAFRQRHSGELGVMLSDYLSAESAEHSQLGQWGIEEDGDDAPLTDESLDFLSVFPLPHEEQHILFQ